jgi:hypothetical protein
MPKDGRSGTTNDGNTARRVFRQNAEFARITGVRQELIYRFYIILTVLNSNKKVNFLNYEKYCSETADFYVRVYPWFYMPAYRYINAVTISRFM